MNLGLFGEYFVNWTQTTGATSQNQLASVRRSKVNGSQPDANCLLLAFAIIAEIPAELLENDKKELQSERLEL